jgi:sugar (pentulose or hexulose) kinase
MSENVIALFDIGKTNKKFLLFNEELKVVFHEEHIFPEISDDDGFPCDDAAKIEGWMHTCLNEILATDRFNLKGINFTTYGASLVYLDLEGNRLTPVYNYLKPMPEGVLDGFYESWGGKEEFCRKTASPALDMLNSGLQALWLKRCKPAVFNKVKTVLHFPQYLSYCFTGKSFSENTSIGCHTAMWDFDNQLYHPWIKKEGIPVPDPVSTNCTHEISIMGHLVKTGIGIHDSSASLVPYLNNAGEPFILISTGTWCIFMNPFNNQPLTRDQLAADTLCYMNINREQVKSSRLFLGHIHDVNVDRLNKYYGVVHEHYKTIKAKKDKINRYLNSPKGRVFFRNGIPSDYTDKLVDLMQFLTFADAYYQLMADLTDLCMQSISCILPDNDRNNVVYITGGFARNELFVQMMAFRLQGKMIYTSEIDNATALGAAMVIVKAAFGTDIPVTDIGLKQPNILE